jgi:hypothetical protein
MPDPQNAGTGMGLPDGTPVLLNAKWLLPFAPVHEGPTWAVRDHPPQPPLWLLDLDLDLDLDPRFVLVFAIVIHGCLVFYLYKKIK